MQDAHSNIDDPEFPNVEDYFLVEPFGHQRDANRTEKVEQARRYSAILQTAFKKTRGEIRDASIIFKDRPRDLLNSFFTISFLRHVFTHELKPEARTLAIVSLVITAEGLLPGIRYRNFVKKGQTKRRPVDKEKSKRFVRLMRECTTDSDKRILLKGFTFCTPQTFPVKHAEPRHLVYRSMTSTHPDHADEYCFPETNDNVGCQCLRWIDALDSRHLDYFFKKLSSKIYEMRCSVVHDAHAVAFCHTEKRPANYASWGFTVADTYTLTSKKKSKWLVRYESCFERDQLERIFGDIYWNAFRKGWPQG